MNTSRTMSVLIATMCLMAFVTSAKAQSCDGPVYHPGSSSGTCACSGSTTGGVTTATCIPATITIMYDYYSCGGNTAEFCSSMEATVGESGLPCTVTFPPALYAVYWAAYQFCGGGPGCVWNSCAFNSCAMGTTSTAVKRQVYIGDSGTCNIAKIDNAPTERLIAMNSKR